MRKIILLLSIVIIFSCKEKKAKPVIVEPDLRIVNNQNPSDDELYALAKMLKDSDAVICPKIENLEIDRDHEVENIEFEKMISNFWGENYNSSNAQRKKFKLSEIKKIMTTSKCYDEYISFETDSTKKDSVMRLINLKDFTLKTPCYSKPLFRLLEKKYSLRPESEFVFTKAKSDKNRFTIIFSVNDVQNTNFYYDLTVWPKIINPIINQ